MNEMLSSGILSWNFDDFISSFNNADDSVSSDSLNVFSSQELIKSSLVLESDSLSFEFIKLSSEKRSKAKNLAS